MVVLGILAIDHGDLQGIGSVPHAISFYVKPTKRSSFFNCTSTYVTNYITGFTHTSLHHSETDSCLIT